jgi:uroporphyrinogen III methyltransferase/synthase
MQKSILIIDDELDMLQLLKRSLEPDLKCIVTTAPSARVALEMLAEGAVDIITFTSSSTVQNFAEMFPEDDLPSLVAKASIACIGPITAQTAREHGLEVKIMPGEYTIEALAAKVVEYFSQS